MLNRIKKHFTIRTLNKILISSLLVLSCGFINTACKVDIKNYLKEYTEQAAINDYTTSLGDEFESYKRVNKNDNKTYYCIPSDNDFTITFQLRNPQKYEFNFGNSENYKDKANRKSMAVFFENLSVIDTIPDDSLPRYEIYNKVPEDTEIYALLKQSDGIDEKSKLYNDGYDSRYYLTLTYSKDFLNKTEMGHNISPTIYLRHPETMVDFPAYSDLRIVSNSVPPTIYSPIVYQNEDNGNYVLLFNMPSQGLLKGIHRDIKTLTIKSSGDGKKNSAYEKKYDIEIYYTPENNESENTNDDTANTEESENTESQVDNYGNNTTTLEEHSNGTFHFPDNDFILIQADPTNKEDSEHYRPEITPTGAVFDQRGQPVYIELSDTLSDEEIVYTLILTDNFGLQSKAEANIRSKKLSELYVTDKENYLILGGEEIKQDRNDSYATVNFIPALRTYWFEDKPNSIQTKYYVDEPNTNVTDDDQSNKTISIAKNFVFDETKINENSFTAQSIISEMVSENRIPSNAYVKVKSAENNEVISYAPGDETLNAISNWTAKCDNTSGCTIVYEVYQGTDDKGKSLFNATFDCIESSGTHPVKNDAVSSDGRVLLDNSGNTLKNLGHYLTLKLPAGDIFVRVYAHKPGYADTTPKEYNMSILRTRVYVSYDGDDESNNGSSNSPYASITKAAEMLSKPTDTTNTIYITSDLTENIVIPKAAETDNPNTSKIETDPLYVKITPSTSSGTFTITPKDGSKPVLTVPDNATVILENINIDSGDIEVGKNAKLYLNNVEFKGKTVTKYEERNKIHVASTGIVILGGKTIIGDEEIEVTKLDEAGKTKEMKTTKAFIELEEGGKVQLGGKWDNNNQRLLDTTASKAYKPQKLVMLRTAENNPKLNIILLETEDGTPIRQSFNAIWADLTKEDTENAYKLFKLDDSRSPGYYIGYDETKAGSSTYGRGLVKIPAAYIVEPIVGGYTVKLYETKYNTNGKYTGSSEIAINETSPYGKNIYVLNKGSKLTYSVFRNGNNLTELNNSSGSKITDLKLELYLEGDIIEQSKENNQLYAPELTIPTTYSAGYYTIYAYFTYDKISYCEHFLVYLKEAN